MIDKADRTDDGWIKRFEAFARSKPADEPYDAGVASVCALAQFGYPNVYSYDLKRLGIPSGVYGAIFGGSTFGALADRLAKLREPRP